MAIGLSCGNSDPDTGTDTDTDKENQTCREVATSLDGDGSFTCTETTPCPNLPEGTEYGACTSTVSDTVCTVQGEPVEDPGATITMYECRPSGYF